MKNILQLQFKKSLPKHEMPKNNDTSDFSTSTNFKKRFFASSGRELTRAEVEISGLGLWNFSVQVRSWSEKIETDRVLVRNIFGNHQSHRVLTHPCKALHCFRQCLLWLTRQASSWSYFPFNQTQLVEQNRFNSAFDPSHKIDTAFFGISKIYQMYNSG